MELIEVLAKIVAVFGYIGLSIWGWVSWVGMHNNTVDGNTFRLLYPMALFDKSQFTDKGNAWRKQHLICYVVCIVLGVTIYAVFNG